MWGEGISAEWDSQNLKVLNGQTGRCTCENLCTIIMRELHLGHN